MEQNLIVVNKFGDILSTNQKNIGQVDTQCPCRETSNRSTIIPVWAQITLIILVISGILGILIYKQASRHHDGIMMTAQDGVDVTENFDINTLLKSKLPTVVDFGSDTCIPCKEMAPILKDLNSTLQGKAVVKFVDVNKNHTASQQYPINLIPTQFFWNADGTPYVPKNAENSGFTLFKNDQGVHVLTSHEGTLTKAEIISILNEMGMSQ